MLPDATVTGATLTITLSNWRGERSIVVHGYGGDGVVQLGEFSATAKIGAATITPGSNSLAFDVRALVADALHGRAAAVEMIVAEDPANAENFEVVFVSSATLVVEYTQQQTRIIDIDIRPDGMPNAINRDSHGTIAVAVLARPDFDVDTVDPASLTFGRTGDEPSLLKCNPVVEDVNGDGLGDLVCHFATPVSGFLWTDTAGVLKGRTYQSIAITGTDSVRIVR